MPNKPNTHTQSAPTMGSDEQQATIKGVFSTQSVIKIGTGTTQRKKIQKSYWFANELENNQVEIQPLNVNYVPSGPKKVIPKEKFLEKQRDIRIKINDFKTLKASYAQQFKQLEARSITKIKKDVLDIVRRIGKKEGFKLIIERNETGAMYYPESLDITDEVIKEYNKTAVKK
jgi:Skp family chaperone for outer membrane proteins